MLFDKIVFHLCIGGIGWVICGDNLKKYLLFCVLAGIGSSAYKHWLLGALP